MRAKVLLLSGKKEWKVKGRGRELERKRGKEKWNGKKREGEGKCNGGG